MGDRDMTEEWPRYQKRWTDLSLKELVNFSRWMNEVLGYHPTVIGGWAVYFYNRRGLGSRDIDVLLPSWEIKHRVIDLYLKNNGYELREKAFGVAEWFKHLIPGDQSSETYLDVCTLQDRNLVHGSDAEIPWAIATEWQRSVKVEGKYDIYIPSPEPLLVLKAKAAWDRAYDIRSGGESEFLRDKLRKDRFDIASLLANTDQDTKLLISIVTKHGFAKMFDDAVSRALDDDQVAEQAGSKEFDRAKAAYKKVIGNL